MTTYARHKKLPDHGLWDRTKGRRIPLTFELELTARCNFDCRHCYINLPAGHTSAANEPTADEVVRWAGQAVDLGALWVLLTGGEPLLRPDFAEIYLRLKRLGLLVSVFTNASLVTQEHVDLFKRYPPRDVEVTVYGVTTRTFGRVTRAPQSFQAFQRGLQLLLDGGIRVRLKAMAMRSTRSEMPRIAAFCRERTKDFFRFDPVLHLRYDRNGRRNGEILSERLSAAEIVRLERSDPERMRALAENCHKLLTPEAARDTGNLLFNCGAGGKSFTIGRDAKMRLCPSLCHPACVYDLRRGSVREGWEVFFERVRARTTQSTEYLEKCRNCGIRNLCLWCPAHAWLETGRLDGWVEYFCNVAKEREGMLRKE